MDHHGWRMPATLIAALLCAPAVHAQSTTFLPEPADYPPCDIPAPVLFAEVSNLNGQPVSLENLVFDDTGTLWLTAFSDGLYRASPDGRVQFVAASERRDTGRTPLDRSNAFMGVAVGPDGSIFVSEGQSIVEAVDGRIVHFPDPASREFVTFADGFDGVNGMTSDGEGNLYLAHGFRPSLWKITPQGEVSLFTEVHPVVNGVVLHPDGQRLVVAPIGDPADSVLAIPLDDPDTREVLFQFHAGTAVDTLSPNPPGDDPVHHKGIDDLDVTADGRVLISAHLRNQFVMGDPATGEACLLLDPSAGAASSIRVAKNFGEWTGWAFSTDFSGQVWAFDIRAGQPEAATKRAPETEATGAGAPAPAAIAALLLLAAAARRRVRARFSILK